MDIRPWSRPKLLYMPKYHLHNLCEVVKNTRTRRLKIMTFMNYIVVLLLLQNDERHGVLYFVLWIYLQEHHSGLTSEKKKFHSVVCSRLKLFFFLRWTKLICGYWVRDGREEAAISHERGVKLNIGECDSREVHVDDEVAIVRNWVPNFLLSFFFVFIFFFFLCSTRKISRSNTYSNISIDCSAYRPSPWVDSLQVIQ